MGDPRVWGGQGLGLPEKQVPRVSLCGGLGPRRLVDRKELCGVGEGCLYLTRMVTLQGLVLKETVREKGSGGARREGHAETKGGQ